MNIRKIIAFLLVIASFAGVLAGCGGAPADASMPTQQTTVQTEPKETKREVTVVGDQLCHMTYNIAGSNTLERIPNFDLNANKRSNIKKVIEQIDPDTFGIQEAPQAWIEGMVGLLDNKYTMVGGYSEEIGVNEKFWYNPLYYKTDKFTCVDSGVMFLNETFKFNKNNRNCAYALLERIADGELILLLSLHLEHRALGTNDLQTYNYTTYYEKTSDRNILRDHQVESLIQIISMKLEEYGKTYNQEISVIVSGDFNINAWDDDEFEHEFTRLKESFAGVNMYDSVGQAAEVITNQSKAEWKSYRDYFSTESPNARLDYIFVTNNLSVDSFNVFDTPYDIGDSSDHHPAFIRYHIGH